MENVFYREKSVAFEFWRGFDLRSRKNKLEKAFRGEKINSALEIPVIVSTGNYFGFGGRDRPPEYWEDPACMLNYQAAYLEEHLKLVDDDLVPYFMPWFGTGVLASAFGCPIKPATGKGDDPAAAGTIVSTPAEAAKLTLPDPARDGLMPKVLQFMDYAGEHGDLPVGPTDLNSPLSTLSQICGYENLFVWMYEEPNLVHDLMSLVTEAFISWVKVQKQHTGEPMDSSNGLQGVWSPKGTGVWISDDDCIAMGAELYAEFAAPCYKKLFTEFSGGSLHFCGDGTHHLETFSKIGAIRAINNSPMGKAKIVDALLSGKPKGSVLQIQDNVPLDPDAYYKNIFSNTKDFRGILVATWVLDNTAMTNEGGYTAISWDPIKTANNTVRAIREAAAEKMRAAA
jgi:uroporphyrinogen-III decarboxylase